METKYFVINVTEKGLQGLEHYKSPAFKIINDKSTMYNINEPNEPESIGYAQIGIVYTNNRYITIVTELARLEARFHVSFVTYED